MFRLTLRAAMCAVGIAPVLPAPPAAPAAPKRPTARSSERQCQCGRGKHQIHAVSHRERYQGGVRRYPACHLIRRNELDNRQDASGETRENAENQRSAAADFRDGNQICQKRRKSESAEKGDGLFHGLEFQNSMRHKESTQYHPQHQQTGVFVTPPPAPSVHHDFFHTGKYISRLHARNNRMITLPRTEPCLTDISPT